MGHKPNTCMIVCKRHCANEGFFLFVDFVAIGIDKYAKYISHRFILGYKTRWAFNRVKRVRTLVWE